MTISTPLEFIPYFGIDLVYVGMGSSQDANIFDHNLPFFTDEWGATWERVEGERSLYFEVRDPPLKNAKISDLETYPWPDPSDPARIESLPERVKYIHSETSLAIAGRFSTSIFEQAFLMRGFEQFLLDLIIDPLFANALLTRTTDIAIGMLTAGMQAAGEYIQILRLAGDDMGHQNGTLLSPKTFRKMIKPHFTRLYRSANQLISEINPEIKIMAHTDGDVYSLIPDYIEMGLDVLNPVQPKVSNMDHTRLKSQFGDTLSFHGGIDIQHLLPFGTPEEVRFEAERTMQALGKGGGYILAPTHYLQPDVPPQNIIALRDAVMTYGHYPLK